MLNVDTGNQLERPENQPELRRIWRLTLITIGAFIVFALLFGAVYRGLDRAVPDTPQEETQQPVGR